MYNLSNSSFSSDSTSPVKYVDTAYDALKYNVPATQQMLQAAQQGQPVGLAGLGAMAAQKFQQNAQSAQQEQNAMQQQQPSPTVLQQIMSGGIMGQLQPNIALNQAPETPPQQMAMGGVVALNEGGFLDYGYDGGAGYAGGGEVRGYYAGEDVALDDELEKETEDEYRAALERAMRTSPARYPIGETAVPIDPTFELPIAPDVKGPSITYADIPVPSDMERKPKKHGFFEIPEGRKFDLTDPFPSSAYWQRPGFDIGRAEMTKGVGAILNPIGKKIDEAKERWSDRYRRAEEEGVLNIKDLIKSIKPEIADTAEIAAVHPSNAAETPKAEPTAEQKKADKGVKLVSQNEIHKEQDAQPKRLAETKGTTSSSATPGLEPMPSEEIRAAEMARIREEMKGEAPQVQARPQMVSETKGITSLPTEWDNKPSAGDYEDQIAELQRIYQGNLTGKLSPEVASRLTAMEDQATRDKWLGALTAFGSGMFGAETPYMSQAIASGALRGLSAYQQGAQNEEQAALRNLQAQMTAEKEPEEARQKAINTYMQAQLASGKSAGEIRKELIKQQALAGRDVYKAGEAEKRAKIMAGVKEEAENTDKMVNAIKIVEKLKESYEYNIASPEDKARMVASVYQNLGISPSSATGGMGGGVGMGGRPIIMGTSGQLIR